MMNVKTFFLLIILCLSCLKELQAQNNIFFHIRSYRYRAEKLYTQAHYSAALEFYQKMAKKDSADEWLILRMADCYRQVRNRQKAEQWYRKLAERQLLEPEDMYIYAELLLSNGHLTESRKWFEKCASLNEYDTIAWRRIQAIDRRAQYFQDSLGYSIEPAAFNSSGTDFSPQFYQEGIVFVSSRDKDHWIKFKNTADNSNFLDLYYRKTVKADKPAKPVLLSSRINGPWHEGPFAFYDNERKIIFTRTMPAPRDMKPQAPLLRTVLYMSEKNAEDRWSEPQPFPIQGTDYSIAQPAMSEDGKKLFFASDMPGGYGGTDLYQCEWRGNEWTQPVNLGPSINTQGNECFPCLRNDTLLYFSSNGWGGIGGLDIYKATVTKQKTFEIGNLGYPLNSPGDDFGITFHPGEPSGFLSSNRGNNGSDDELFCFRSVRVKVEGIVKGKLKNNPIPGAMLRIFADEEEVLAGSTSEDGSFIFYLRPGKNYTVRGTREDFRTYITDIALTATHRDTSIYLEILLEKNLKTLIRGVVIDSNKTIADLKIIYKEKGAQRTDTITSDISGEFHTEIDPDYEYIFYTEKEGKFGKVNIKNSSRKNGTFLLYTNIELHPYISRTFKGIVRENDSTVAGAKVTVYDEVTMHSDTLYTDLHGTFSVDLYSYGSYIITAASERKKEFLRISDIEKSPDREILFNLKKEGP